MTLGLILAAVVLAATSGLPGVLLRRSSGWGERIAVWMIVGAAIAGLAGVIGSYGADHMATAAIPWLAAGSPVVGVDALSAFFLFPILLMGGLGAVYGWGYWPQSRHRGNGRKLRLFWGLTVAGMLLLVIAKDGMSFLLGWEVMALSAYFLITTEDCRARCRNAGWVYLIATHLGTLTLFAMFALWRWATGSYAIQPAAGMSDMVKNALFFMALLGFGLKAGIMPLHFWLPSAHANAPSHVSALMSGIVLKMGIYGLLRMLSLLPSPPPVWGGLILLLGVVSGLLGVVFAIGQHDLKRLLAYHSVENIGIILMGMGLAVLGRSMHRPEWVVLGLAGCLLHVWNHSLFKSLLFMCAGSVVHGAHTREIDRLGGLAKIMPWTSGLFVVGAVAICGLPPLNGFVSELLVYIGSLQGALKGAAGGSGGSAVMLIAPVLAMIGALAVACFVKVCGAVFLGSPRTQAAVNAHEAPLSMRGPAMVLAGLCIAIGLAPMAIVPVLDVSIAAWMPELRQSPLSIGDLVPFNAVSTMAIALVALVVLGGLVLMKRRREAARAGTWDCGYARPTNRMQYSASSFAQMIVVMFNWVLHPRTHLPQVSGLFPRPASMHSHVDDAVMDRVLLPSGQRIERSFVWFHRFQQGLTQHYVLYILITVIVMLSTLIPFDAFLARLFAP